MRKQFKKAKVASFICMALSASVATNSYAAEEEKKKKLTETEVTGVRGSLSAELAAKRSSDAISDSIIAEAISRIAGVSLDGEGNTITVRGIEAALNDIKLNCISMTISSDDQAVDLSLFSADMLSRIDVVKSPSANQEEGSLGASINLQTRAPLSSKKSQHTLSIEGRYNDLSEETRPRFSYFFIENFLENLGFSGSFFHDTQNRRQESFSTNTYHLKHYYNSSLGGEALDKRSIDTKLYDFDSGEELTDIKALSGGAFKNRIRLSETVKKGGTFTVQYLLGEKLSFSAKNLTNSSNKVFSVLTNTQGYEDTADVVREVSNNLDNLSDVRVVSIDSPSRS